MHELRHSIPDPDIPDPDVLLALEQKGLAGVLLRCLRDRVAREGRAINPHNYVIELRNGDPYRPDSGYPQHRVSEVQVAVMEAFAWLEAQALLVPDRESPGGRWKILSRRSQRLETQGVFQQFRMARQLNRDLLHPKIAEKVWLAFVRCDFAEAVFTAMRRFRSPHARRPGFRRATMASR